MVHVMNYQLAIFFQKNIERPDKFFDSLNESVGNIFDRMPQITPMPIEVPLEIPRVAAASSNGLYVCNIAINRMDFTIQVADSKLKENEAITDFILKSRLIIKNIPLHQGILRLGIIGNFFELDKLPSVTLAKKFSRKDLGNVNEFSLRYNKLTQEFGHSFNNIFAISNAEIKIKGIDSAGIFIQKDINNMPSGIPIAADDIIDIINKKMKEFTSDSIERNS